MSAIVWVSVQQALRQCWRFVSLVYKHFMADNCRENAMMLTYTTLFAVVPIMTVTFTIISAFPSMQKVSGDIQTLIFRNFIPSSGTTIQNYLSDFSAQASHLTVVGIGMLVVTALLMLVTIEKSFNQIWKVHEERKGVVSFLRYWAVLSLGPLLLGAGFLISSYVLSLQLFSSAASMVSGLVPGLRLLPLLLSVLAFTLLYIAVPNCKVPLRAAAMGGVVAALLFEAAKRGFALFISGFSSYKLVYGAFAAFPVFLLWIYVSWIIILLGVEVSRSFALFQVKVHASRHPVVAMLDILQLFYRKHQSGSAVTDVDAMAVLGQQEAAEWFEFASILQAQKLIQRTDAGEFILMRSLDTLDFWTFYQALPWPLPRPEDLEPLPSDQHWAHLWRADFAAVNTLLAQRLGIPLAKILADQSKVSVVEPVL